MNGADSHVDWKSDRAPTQRLAPCRGKFAKYFLKRIGSVLLLEPLHGCGLHLVLRGRSGVLSGILNGIDTAIWDPAEDPHLAAPFALDDLSGKATCRAALVARMGLKLSGGPIVVLVTRLVEQKGVDLLLPVVPFLAGMGAQLVVLGSGDAELVQDLHAVASAHPQSVRFVPGYDESLAHQLFAGGDLLAMPSRFEPCGLTQMQALRYGTLPVATAVGGLRDTIVDLDADPIAGTGWLAESASSLALLDALHRAVSSWSDPSLRRSAQHRGMARDWSWAEPAKQHLDLYAHVVSSLR